MDELLDYKTIYSDAKKPEKPKPTPHSGNTLTKGMTNNGMRTGSDFKTPTFDYMGYAFDAAVRKGKTASRLALKEKMNGHNLSPAEQAKILRQFDKNIGNQWSLNADSGLGDEYTDVYRDAAKKKQEINLKEADKRVAVKNAQFADIGKTF